MCLGLPALFGTCAFGEEFSEQGSQGVLGLSPTMPQEGSFACDKYFITSVE